MDAGNDLQSDALEIGVLITVQDGAAYSHLRVVVFRHHPDHRGREAHRINELTQNSPVRGY